MPKGKSVTFRWEISKQCAEKLTNMANRAGVSEEDIVGSAMAMIEWAIEQIQRGRIIASVDEKDKVYQEIIFPILKTLKNKMREEGDA